MWEDTLSVRVERGKVDVVFVGRGNLRTGLGASFVGLDCVLLVDGVVVFTYVRDHGSGA